MSSKSVHNVWRNVSKSWQSVATSGGAAGDTLPGMANRAGKTDVGSLSGAERDELLALRRQVRRQRAERDFLFQEQGISPTQRAILDATETLLANTSLNTLSVARIIAAAGVSRATFYTHYRSKNAAVVALLNRVFARIFDVIQPWLERDVNEAPDIALRAILSAAARIWAAHAAVLRAVQEGWPTVPEFEELWLSVMHRFRDALTAQIQVERQAGSAPAGAPADVIAVGLIWASERTFYISTRAVEPMLPDPTAAVEALMALWIPTIYAVPYTPPLTAPSA